MEKQTRDVLIFSEFLLLPGLLEYKKKFSKTYKHFQSVSESIICLGKKKKKKKINQTSQP